MSKEWSLEGEGVVLRALRTSDQERWFELLHDPAQLAFGSPAFIPLPDRPEDLAERVARSRASAGTHEATALAITTGDDRFLGNVGFRHAALPPMGVVDVGYAVHPDARGDHLATRSLKVLVRWLARHPDGPHVARVQLDHSVDNQASCRVALGAGFEREGVRRSFLPLRDADAPGGVRRHDVCLHGLVTGDAPDQGEPPLG